MRSVNRLRTPSLILISIIIFGCSVTSFSEEATDRPTQSYKHKLTHNYHLAPTPTTESTSTPKPTHTPNLLVWEVIPSVELFYSRETWVLESESINGNEYIPAILKSIDYDKCYLMENYGRGYPEDWSVIKDNIVLGEMKFVKKQFFDGNNNIQFIVYYSDFIDLFQTTPEDWKSCSKLAEEVLKTLHTNSKP